jgi:hypothetical protein
MGGMMKLAGMVVTVVLIFGLAACGSSDSTTATLNSGSSSTSRTKPPPPSAKESPGSQTKTQTKESPKAIHRSEAKEASEFAPKPHNDSGGGSKQFEVKGGDNSVQEFGGEADASELDKAANALHNFLDARAEGNWAATCTYMSKATIESFEKLAAQSKQPGGASCAAILEKLMNPAARQSMKAEAEKANVRSLRTEGEQAFVIYTGLDGTILAMPMANEDGEWKVASLAGTPLN